MKKMFFIPAALFFMTGCYSELQITVADVPSAVESAFQSKYHGATMVHWTVETDKDKRLVYEAHFKMSNKKVEAEFKPDGTFIKEE